MQINYSDACRAVESACTSTTTPRLIYDFLKARWQDGCTSFGPADNPLLVLKREVEEVDGQYQNSCLSLHGFENGKPTGPMQFHPFKVVSSQCANPRCINMRLGIWMMAESLVPKPRRMSIDAGRFGDLFHWVVGVSDGWGLDWNMRIRKLTLRELDAAPLRFNGLGNIGEYTSAVVDDGNCIGEFQLDKLAPDQFSFDIEGMTFQGRDRNEAHQLPRPWLIRYPFTVKCTGMLMRVHLDDNDQRFAWMKNYEKGEKESLKLEEEEVTAYEQSEADYQRKQEKEIGG